MGLYRKSTVKTEQTQIRNCSDEAEKRKPNKEFVDPRRMETKQRENVANPDPRRTSATLGHPR